MRELTLDEFMPVYIQWVRDNRASDSPIYDSHLGRKLGIGCEQFRKLRDRLIAQCRSMLEEKKDREIGRKMRDLEARHLRDSASNQMWDWEAGWENQRLVGAVEARRVNTHYARVQSRKFG